MISSFNTSHITPAMSKRGAPDGDHYQPPHKKRSHGPPPQSASQTILPDPLPPLPQLSRELAAAPFIHKSSSKYSRASATTDLSYERLEFLGDAYIELFSSEIIFTRYPSLSPGQMSQLRELLVKNETLATYSRAYRFETKIEIDSLRQMEASASKGNKGINKVLGDVFEAYLAAVVLSDGKDGIATAKKWAAALWKPRLVTWEQGSSYRPPAATNEDRRKVYDSNAKQELAKLLIWTCYTHCTTSKEHSLVRVGCRTKRLLRPTHCPSECEKLLRDTFRGG
jgi:ribonuclease-3